MFAELDVIVLPDEFIKQLIRFLLDKSSGHVTINVNDGRIEQYEFTQCFRIKRNLNG